MRIMADNFDAGQMLVSLEGSMRRLTMKSFI